MHPVNYRRFDSLNVLQIDILFIVLAGVYVAKNPRVKLESGVSPDVLHPIWKYQYVKDATTFSNTQHYNTMLLGYET